MSATLNRVGLTVMVGWLILGSGSGLAAAELPSQAAFSGPYYVYGEIAWVDTRMGRLVLEERAGRYRGAPSEYVITPQKTSVTDSLDRQFLQLEDLQPGQFVGVEFTHVKGRRLAHAIVVEPTPTLAGRGQLIFGEVVSIDLRTREFVVRETVPGKLPPAEMTYRIAAPEGVAFTEERTGEPILLEDLRVGQWVRIQLSPQAGERLVARSIARGEPPAMLLHRMSGEVESIDVRSLTLELRETKPGWKAEETTAFLLDAPDTQVFDVGTGRLLRIEDLKAGDVVDIQFQLDRGGRRLGRHIFVSGSARP